LLLLSGWFSVPHDEYPTPTGSPFTIVMYEDGGLNVTVSVKPVS
jgi:hypothetical protein